MKPRIERLSKEWRTSFNEDGEGEIEGAWFGERNERRKLKKTIIRSSTPDPELKTFHSPKQFHNCLDTITPVFLTGWAMRKDLTLWLSYLGCSISGLLRCLYQTIALFLWHPHYEKDPKTRSPLVKKQNMDFPLYATHCHQFLLTWPSESLFPAT